MLVTIFLVRRKNTKIKGYAIKFQNNNSLTVFHEGTLEPEVMTAKQFDEQYEAIFLKAQVNLIDYFKSIFHPHID